MQKMLQRADAIVVATEGHIKHSAYLGPYKEKCVVIPYGVDHAIEDAADRYTENKVAEQIIDIASPKEKKRYPSFLFVGRLVYYKGCDVLLKAFAKAKDAELVIVGSGALEEECHRLAENLGIQERVRFMGEVSEQELQRHMAECDVFVLPSVAKSEAFGIVQIEAMAYGKPVINTNLPSGAPYVSIHGETGLTVEPGNAEQLAEAMQWMAEHKEERFAMGRKARERMKTEYRQEVMTTRVLKLYREVTKETY